MCSQFTRSRFLRVYNILLINMFLRSMENMGTWYIYKCFYNNYYAYNINCAAHYRINNIYRYVAFLKNILYNLNS